MTIFSSPNHETKVSVCFSRCRSALCHIILNMNASLFISVRTDLPLDTRIDCKQMRRFCRTAGVHAVSATPWLLHPLTALHSSTSYPGLQGFSIHPARTVSSIPLHSFHIPAEDSCLSWHATSWPPPFLLSLNSQTTEACWKNRQNGKSDNAMTQQIFQAAFFAYSAICQKNTNACILVVPSQLNSFLLEGF